MDRITIEGDSDIVVSAIRHQHIKHWNLAYDLRNCLQYLSPGFHIHHVYRQKNQVADRLADWAHQHRGNMDFFRARDLPNSVRTALVGHQIGLWNFCP